MVERQPRKWARCLLALRSSSLVPLGYDQMYGNVTAPRLATAFDRLSLRVRVAIYDGDSRVRTRAAREA